MKNWLVVIFLIFAVSMFYAHNPKDVKLAYDAAKGELSVTVEHLIKETKQPDPTKHYIKEIIVSLNGTKGETKTFKSQESTDFQKAMFKLKAKKGDKIAVTANCVISGTKTVELVVK